MAGRILVALAMMAFSMNAIAADEIKNVTFENVWKDSSGRFVIEFASNWNSEAPNPEFFYSGRLFAGDENGLYQLSSPGYSGSSEHHVFSFEDQRATSVSKFLAGVSDAPAGTSPHDTDEYLLVCDATKTPFTRLTADESASLLEKIHSGQIPLNPLPDSVRETAYLFKVVGTDQYIYVDQSKYHFDYRTFRLWLGTLNNMQEVKIANVLRASDGGTTYITTEDGRELFSPTPFETENFPTWEGTKRLERIRDGFDLQTLGITGVPTSDVQLHTPCDPYFGH
jgi:hypothetical protein